MPRALLHTDWTEQEIAHLKRLVAKGYALTRISRRLRPANETVLKKAAEHGITLPPSQTRQRSTYSHGRPR